MVARTRRERRPLTPDRQALAERYYPLALALARPLKRSFPADRDEFESAAGLALVEAAESYDPRFGVKFPTFARHRISGALRDVQRNRIPGGYRDDPEAAPSVLSTSPAVDEDGYCHEAPAYRLLWQDHIEDPANIVGAEPAPPVGFEFDEEDAVEHWLRKLPTRHAEALRRIYLHGDTHARAGAALGLSASRIAFMHREALAMLNGSWYAAAARP